MADRTGWYPEIAAMREALRRVVGDHQAPSDCYSTGPLHGDYRDYQCPSCAAKWLLDAAIAAKGE